MSKSIILSILLSIISCQEQKGVLKSNVDPELPHDHPSIVDVPVSKVTAPTGPTNKSASIKSKTYISNNQRMVRYGDRNFVSGTLLSVFGTTSANAIRNFVQNNVEIFGGVCRLYDDKVSCDAFAEQRIFLPWTMPRNGATVQVCEEIMDHQENIYHALKNASINPTDPITTVTLKRVYELFFLGEDPPATLLASMMAVAKTSSDTVNGYGNVLLALCVTPEWQVP